MRTLAALLVFSTAANAQQIYRWTDKKGEAHYTDDVSTVPKGAKLETTEGEELMVVPAPPPSPTVPAPKTIPVPRAPAARAPQTGSIEVRLTKINVAVSDADRAYIEESLRTAAASPRLASWGGLRESIEVEIAPGALMTGYSGSDAFGQAVGTNKMRLRAPKDTVSHGFVLDYPGAALHELAHLLEHQLAGTSRPPWFAEGFACVVADQTRHASIDDIAWWVIHEGGERPLEQLMSGKCPIGLAYAIAKEAVRYLVELVGEAGLKQMFELRAKGQPFDAAFSRVAGFTVQEFEGRFIKSLRPNYYDRAR
ncbi:MAG: DUF4124 domain-containing protein [Archangium sp.]|nr:DUF4124 domain-containing protein [Archangium sp.]MDP3155250.1 DUF4124 domain-containing protein [Archangium sp.]MDP3570911.1 DUF4124 domain-containing protein [Archangium sp.]